MGDRYPAQIRIGGQVSRTAKSKTDPDETVLYALLGIIAVAGVSDEYGSAPAEPDDEATLIELVDEDGWLRLRDEEATNGELEELEEFCREESLPYCRNCCAYGGYLGEDVTWLPGMSSPLEILETDDGSEQVRGSEVRRALAMLVNADEMETPDLDEHAKNSLRDHAKHILQGLCPEQLVVPKFEVIP